MSTNKELVQSLRNDFEDLKLFEVQASIALEIVDR